MSGRPYWPDRQTYKPAWRARKRELCARCGDGGLYTVTVTKGAHGTVDYVYRCDCPAGQDPRLARHPYVPEQAPEWWAEP